MPRSSVGHARRRRAMPRIGGLPIHHRIERSRAECPFGVGGREQSLLGEERTCLFDDHRLERDQTVRRTIIFEREIEVSRNPNRDVVASAKIKVGEG